jgi:hypothetical protein
MRVKAFDRSKNSDMLCILVVEDLFDAAIEKDGVRCLKLRDVSIHILIMELRTHRCVMPII